MYTIAVVIIKGQNKNKNNYKIQPKKKNCLEIELNVITLYA